MTCSGINRNDGRVDRLQQQMAQVHAVSCHYYEIATLFRAVRCGRRPPPDPSSTPFRTHRCCCFPCVTAVASQTWASQVMGQLSNMTEVLRISQGENQINTATIARLTARVDGLLAVLNSTAADAGLAPPTVCDDASAAGGAPSIQVVGDDIKVLACGGAVEFSSSSCTVDPCRTQRDLDDIKARVGLL